MWRTDRPEERAARKKELKKQTGPGGNAAAENDRRSDGHPTPHQVREDCTQHNTAAVYPARDFTLEDFLGWVDKQMNSTPHCLRESPNDHLLYVIYSV